MTRFEPIRDNKIAGIKSASGNRHKLLAICQHCKCARYTPCGCNGAVKERESKAKENAA